MNHDESGATGVEYALVIGLVSVLIVAAVVLLGGSAVDFVRAIDLGL